LSKNNTRGLIRVQVYPPPFASLTNLDEDGMMILPPGARLATVYRQLKIPLLLQPLVICQVNYQRVKLNTQLKDGDVISFMLPLAGG
jgi:molybdopterin converting factor small subunit